MSYLHLILDLICIIFVPTAWSVTVTLENGVRGEFDKQIDVNQPAILFCSYSPENGGIAQQANVDWLYSTTKSATVRKLIVYDGVVQNESSAQFSLAPPASLQIKSALIANTGFYECRISIPSDGVSMGTYNVTVLGTTSTIPTTIITSIAKIDSTVVLEWNETIVAFPWNTSILVVFPTTQAGYSATSEATSKTAKQTFSTLSTIESTVSIQCNKDVVSYFSNLSILVVFPSTQAGYSSTSETSCGNDTVSAGIPYGSRNCLLNGTWGEITWLSSCMITLQDLENITITTPEKRLEVANDLQLFTSEPETLNAENVSSAVVALETVVNTSNLEQETASSVVQTVGNLLNVSEEELQKSDETSKILDILDAVGKNVVLEDGKNYEEVAATLGFAVAQINSKNVQQPGIGYVFKALSIPSDRGFQKDQLNIFEMKPTKGNVTSFVYVPDEVFKKSPESRVSFYAFLDDSLFHSITQQSEGKIVNSEIILAATVVGNDDVKNLKSPIELYFSYIRKDDVELEAANTECVFWDVATQLWTNGGTKTNSSDSGVYCIFNHLTNFATLFTPCYNVNNVSLNWITLTGSSISSACLVLTLIIFAFMRSTSTGTKFRSSFLLANLCLALLCLNLLLILSEQDYVTSSDEGCIAVAVLLHFFFLSAMAWMTNEAFFIYMTMVHVIYTKAHVTDRMVVTISSLWGWLMPAVFVSIVIGIDVDNYMKVNDQCWISLDLIEHLVVIPCAILLGFNLILYVITTYKVTCGRKAVNKNSMRRSDVKRNLVFSWTLFLTVGGTWIFGFFVFASNCSKTVQLAFSYIFAILNSLQGFFLFLMYIVRQGLLCTFIQKARAMMFKNRYEIRSNGKAKNRPMFELQTKIRTSKLTLPSDADNKKGNSKLCVETQFLQFS